MQIVRNPKRSEWRALCKRPTTPVENLQKTVREILEQVRTGGDRALKSCTAQFDNVSLDEIKISEEELKEAAHGIDSSLMEAIMTAKANIETFHSLQKMKEERIETTPGITCFRRSVPIERVGLYVPGGTASLFSTLLMLAIPAKLAGCKRIIVTTPPPVSSTLLACASILELDEIYKVGGVQAIAALAYGTESVSPVYKIFGPGNQYVTCAKQLVAAENGVAIDLPAGPSEVLVIADEAANPTFVAADLLSQVEHGTDSQAVLLTTSSDLLDSVQDDLVKQLETLPRREIAATALQSSRVILFESSDDAIEFSNQYAPEHLILAISDPESVIEKITAAGSVFLGNYTPESLGDYASGTNHTLPTTGYAQAYSGVSLDSFVKNITFQQATPEGLQALGPIVERLAEAEGFTAHSQAVAVRLSGIQGENE